ncbi:MAG: SH3 domain-containing protein [Thermodesulfovibrionales bacterium]
MWDPKSKTINLNTKEGKYYSFRVLKRKGMWVKVRDEQGNIGWIHRNHLWIQ